MSDNVQLNPGTGGDLAAADDIGGVKYQRVKLVLGDDGAAEGDVSSARPMPISVASLPLPSGAATEATLGGVQNLLMRILQMLLAPLGFDKSLQRQRSTAIIESGTVTTVTTVTGLTNINGFNGDMLIRGQVNAAWALNVRARIT